MREVKQVEYAALEENVLAASIQYAGLVELDTSTGTFNETMIEVPTYARYRKKTRSSTDRNKRYYSWGPDNNFPLFLLKLKSRSHLLKTIVGAITTIAKGKGLVVSGPDEDLTANFKKWLTGIGAGKDFRDRLFMNMCFYKGIAVELGYGSLDLDNSGNLVF